MLALAVPMSIFYLISILIGLLPETKAPPRRPPTDTIGVNARRAELIAHYGFPRHFSCGSTIDAEQSVPLH
jgi:hypothetical protein